MGKISAAEVCRQFKIDKSKVSRALKNGELSGLRNKNGQGWQIEVSEAERWASSLVRRSHATETVGSSTPSATPETAVLEEQVRGLREMLDMMKANEARLIQERDDWKDQAKASQRLLEDHTAKAEKLARGGFFSLFRGRAA